MTRKIVFFLVMFLCIGVSSFSLDRDEIILFDSGGNAMAYIDTADHDFTIYLWNGTPTAYIVGNDIYGFNGEHLGWYQNGIIRDNDGYVVGAIKNAFSGITKIEPIKGIKKIKPIQSIRRIAPIAPIFKNSWSRNDLQSFLYSGVKR
jgi:hypothetical protein